MIRITRQTDYGILILTFMAGKPVDHVHATRDVADGAGLPVPMVSKILKMLAREGLLVSQRGVKGGYRLAHEPDRISIAEIIAALEGPIGMTECASNPGGCERESGCPVKVNWQRISVAVSDALGKIPLSEMTASRPSDLLVIGTSIDTERTRAS